MNKIKSLLKSITNHPGVYKMLDINNKVIYVGKAKNLKKRVLSYFSKNHTDLKTELLVSLIHSFETIVTNTENEALILERELIRTYKPRFNILLKDDKSYPYIKVTKTHFPRILITRERKDDNAYYFGPFPNAGSSKFLEKALLHVFPLRSCKQYISLNKKEAKCILMDIGKCVGPCVNKSVKLDYEKLVNELLLFLKGKDKELIKNLQKRMTIYSDKLEYEKAAIIRDRLARLLALTEKQLVSLDSAINLSILGVQQTNEIIYVLIQEIVDGKLLYQQGFFNKQGNESENRHFIELCILKWCNNQNKTKAIVLCSNDTENLLNMSFKSLKIDIKLMVPKIGDKKVLLQGAERNARLALNRLSLMKTNKISLSLEEVQDTLQLSRLPKRILGFDISHLQGSYIVASSVYFLNGKPYKKGYRHFSVKTVSGKSNDPKSMKEVVGRRLKRMQDENEELPDLLVIDGGKGQLNFAMQAIRDLNLEDQLDCISLAKRYEDIYFPGESKPKRLLHENPVLKLLQQVRDESHRFAVAFQRKKRQQQYESIFADIKGIGKKKLSLLYNTYKDLAKVQDASIEELCDLLKITQGLALEIKQKTI